MRKTIYLLLLLIGALLFSAGSVKAHFVVNSGEMVNISPKCELSDAVVTALKILGSDFDKTLESGFCQLSVDGKSPTIILDVVPVKSPGCLSVTGTDSAGLCYGIVEISRLLGVSPWEWWADVTPRKSDRLMLPIGFETVQSPSVEYRGIFINDEDWGLMPWSSMTVEPVNKFGGIGPKTTERIFELMLRLRANTYWPPMHECSEPFFLTPGNRKVAKRYGIFIGGPL